ncbi:PREDICTED: myeloid cell surface antigen CD33-like [Chinchilla lanigera]|uniref:myeloid cell surface antigen CD33-like n=1 Tax=Chinchilla lanigera TaxID=34839 RepID=UPI00038EF506|nr:PREDICTED: myeloid cell surface antigen CD33-like [Chinchilla lanigera]
MLLLLPLLLLWVPGEGQGALQIAGPHLPSGCSFKSLKYRLQVPESVTVQEGQCVLVPCSFLYSPLDSRPGSVSGYWFQEGANTNLDSPVATNDPGRQAQERTRSRFHLLLDPNTKNCSLHIRDAQKEDSGSYFFRVQSGSVQWNYCADRVSVEVTALTHTPDILTPRTLMPGLTINLTCSVPWACEHGTPPIFSWTSAALTSLGPRTTLSSLLTLNPRPQDHGTNLTCQVMFPAAGVTVERTVQLNVTGSLRTKATAGVVQGALGGAAVTALLGVCICVIFFIVKTLKKKAPRTVGDTKNTEPATGPAFLGHPPEPSSSSTAVPTSGEEQEVHYASISFHPRK